ncbi:MAG: flavin-containing monooxygenase [Candidatus Puniceispirillaceae bacterium]
MPDIKTARSWLEAFCSGAGDTATLFADDALWRDYLAFHWDLRTHEGKAAIQAALPEHACALTAEIEQLSPHEFIFSFDGKHGGCRGLLEFRDGQCTRLFTSLQDMGATGPVSEEADPQVLVIGGGQSGLALGARLVDQGVPYLIVEQNERVGDNWRNRYDSLVLHDPAWVNHLPFKPFPDDWPAYTPKDMMGDWLEGYADSLGLNVACGTRVGKAQFDETNDLWTVELAIPRGKKIMRVPHIVFAVGTSGFAHTPDFPGTDMFTGQQMHSSAYASGAEFTGKNIAIVGATNSAHDIAVDLVKHGAKPTLIQRSSTHVVPHQVYVEDILGALYSPKSGNSLARSDFLSLAMPMRRLEERARALFGKVQQEWAGFYDGLRSNGFTVDFAEDGTGIVGKYRRSASGYYIDVGGSQRVMDGEIAMRSGVGVDRLDAGGIILSDGSRLPSDAVIYATGFGSMEEWVARLIDTKTAQKIGRCWGYGSGFRGDPGPWEGELRNMWKPTAQQGLWFMGGNLAQVRMYSHYLALQLRKSCS